MAWCRLNPRWVQELELLGGSSGEGGEASLFVAGNEEDSMAVQFRWNVKIWFEGGRERERERIIYCKQWLGKERREKKLNRN
jgi:hypothetical protein